MSASLFQRLLGAEFYHLAPAVKALHLPRGNSHWHGQCSIQRGRHPLARLAAFVTRMPPSMQAVPLHVHFHAEAGREVWQRDFNGHVLRSVLSKHHQHLGERLGPVSFRFRLYRIGDELRWIGEGARIFGILPLPASWLDGVRSREYSENGRYHFEVDARLPWIGRIVHYQGWLQPANEAQAGRVLRGKAAPPFACSSSDDTESTTDIRPMQAVSLSHKLALTPQ